MFLIDMRISFACPLFEHNKIMARAIEGQPAQFGSDGSQPSANWPVEVGEVLRQAAATKVEPTKLALAAHNLRIVRTFPFGTRSFR
jgi:hypothetical protein